MNMSIILKNVLRFKVIQPAFHKVRSKFDLNWFMLGNLTFTVFIKYIFYLWF